MSFENNVPPVANALPQSASAANTLLQSASTANVSPQSANAMEVCSLPENVADADALPEGVPLLFIDASAPFVQVGVWRDGHWLAHRCTDAPALEEIFRSVSTLLGEAGLSFANVGGFIHNEGPGSILGIRLAAMALRIWAQGRAAELPDDRGACAPLPIWAVRSLALVAAKLALENTGAAGAATHGKVRSDSAGCAAPDGVRRGDGSEKTDFADAHSFGGAVFSEFRQGLWNWFAPSGADVFGDGIEVIETEELAERIAASQGRVWHLRHRKSWEAPPGEVALADGNLRTCPQVFQTAGLLRRVTLPEAFLTRPPEFKTASGERHRGTANPAHSSADSTQSSAAPARAGAGIASDVLRPVTDAAPAASKGDSRPQS